MRDWRFEARNRPYQICTTTDPWRDIEAPDCDRAIEKYMAERWLDQDDIDCDPYFYVWDLEQNWIFRVKVYFAVKTRTVESWAPKNFDLHELSRKQAEHKNDKTCI